MNAKSGQERIDQDLTWLWLVLGLGLAFFLGLGQAPLFDLDEGAFSAATFEMLARGDFVTTYLNGELRFDKPILIYWLQAASVSLVGVNEWGFRLPSAVAASLWALALFSFARPRMGNEAGLAAALMLAFAVASWVIGRAATADALLNLWLTLTLLDVYRFWETPRRVLVDRVALWMGLGFLTKGPVAIVIPLVVGGVFFVSTGRWRDAWRAAWQVRSWFIFMAVALPWYVLEYLAQGQSFIDGFFLEHNVGRFTATMEKHGGSVLYYFPVVFLIVLPFTGLFVRTLSHALKLWTDPLDRFLWLWFGFVFLFFSFSSTQLPHYLLYGATALFLLMARYRETLVSRWLAFGPAGLVLLLLPWLPAIGQWLAVVTDDVYIAAMLARSNALANSAYWIWTWGAVGLVLVLWRFSKQMPWRGLLLVGALQVTVLTQAVVPWLGALQQQPVREAALLARQLDLPVVMAGANLPSFTVYRQAVTPRRDPLPGEVVLTRVHKLDRWPQGDILFNEGGIALVRLP